MIARVFQAFRIAVNQELDSLKFGLQVAYTVLEPKARIAVVSFHSLEDRLVKRAFGQDMWKNVGSFVRAKKEERENNSRSRSATLRIAEKQ
jgi:16S rRNA (cytosine1402-N4)-methyltransferase